MNPWVARLLVRMYPRRWRQRYGRELEELLVGGRGSWASAVDVLGAAVGEYFVPTQGGSMEPMRYSFGSVMRRPSAFLPLAMSLTALTMVLGYVAMYGHARPTDEGAVGHLWQLLMAGQVPIIVFFAIKWLPRARRLTFYVLAEQLAAVLASVAVVFLLGLG